MQWFLECQTRKEHHRLDDQAAIQYAIIAAGETLRGICGPEWTFASWEEFVSLLKPKVQHVTKEWELILETGNLVINVDWPRYHSLFQTYRLVVPQEFPYTLMVHIIKGWTPCCVAMWRS